MKALLKVLVFIGILVALIYFGRNVIVKAAVERGVKKLTGLSLSLGRLNLGADQTVDIGDLKIENPPAFVDPTMLDMPQIYVAYNLRDIIKGKIHLREVRIHLKELVVVRNTDRELNLNSLTALSKAKEAEDDKPAQKVNFQIDTLKLKVGRVIYKDYTQAQMPPVVKEYKININQTYRNITDPNKLVSLIVARALAKTTIAALTGYDIDALNEVLGGAFRKTAEGTTSILTDSAQKAAEQLKGVTREITDTLKIPLESF